MYLPKHFWLSQEDLYCRLRMPQRTIRYGIIGFGRFAERLIGPAIRRSRDSTLVALQKRSAEAARRKADDFGVPLAFSSPEELVRHPDVDAVFVTSANSAHCPETLIAAEAGKHVIVEKPMALSVDEATKMIAACKAKNIRFMVGHMVRLSPLVRRIKSLIDSGRIGAVKGIRTEFWYDGRQSHRPWLLDRVVAGGGPVFDIGVHCLDTIRYLLGTEPIEVASVLAPEPTAAATEESAIVGLRFPGDILASIFCSYTSPVRRSFIEVVGTEALIAVNDFTLSSHQGRLILTRGKANEPASPVVEEIRVSDLYVEEISQFTAWILGGPEPELTGENGLNNQRVLEEICGHG
jgi:1,5-anhydro-D-fructose reductase (1,5-anhydro-D-mannitol-forming)